MVLVDLSTEECSLIVGFCVQVYSKVTEEQKSTLNALCSKIFAADKQVEEGKASY